MPRRGKDGGTPPFLIEGPEASDHVNMVLYGDTGEGKTHLLGTIVDVPEAMPALLIDTDGGTATIKDRDIEVTRPRNWKQMQEVYDFLRHDNTRYRSCLVDGLTETQQVQSMGVLLNEVEDDGDQFRNLGATVVADRQDWLRSGNQMRKFIRAFKGLSYLPDAERRLHVVMTARERVEEKRKVTTPQLPGQLGSECGAFVDILARISSHDFDKEDDDGNTIGTETRRMLLLAPYTNDTGMRYLAKNRGGNLPRAMWDPTMKAVIAAWRA